MKSINYVKEFGIKIFISKGIRKFVYKNDSNLAWKINEYNEQLIEKYLVQELSATNINMGEYLRFKNEKTYSAPIWTMWWQGEKNAPEIVKACINSMRKHSGSHEVIVISEENIGKYLVLPKFIMEKVKKGEISRTHLSDMIRLSLLYIYGGGWIDATVYISDDLPDNLYEYQFYSIKTGVRTKDPSHGRWSTFTMFSQKNNQMLKKILELHYIYWKQHKQPVDYVIFDYIIQHVIKQNREYLDEVLNVPLNNRDVFQLRNKLNIPWTGWADLQIADETIFHKLSWKAEYINKCNGMQTVYGYILNDSIGNIKSDLCNYGKEE